jgi:hypothetical protein
MPRYDKPSATPSRQPSQTVSPPSATQNTLYHYLVTLSVAFYEYALVAPHLTHGNKRLTLTASVE